MTMAECTCVCHYGGSITCMECCPPYPPVSTAAEPPMGTNAPVNGDYNKPAGDHNRDYEFGRVGRWTFTEREFARLLIIRGRLSELNLSKRVIDVPGDEAA